MNKTERFREIAAEYKDELGYRDPYVWHETEPGAVFVDGHTILIVESTNFNAKKTIKGDYNPEYGDPDWDEWVVVSFEDELYRLSGVFNSWEGTEWGEWERVEKRPVTIYEYVEVDK